MKTKFINNIETSKYDNCYLKTDEIKAKNNAFVKNELKFSITILDDQTINENWLIEAIGLCQYHNLIGISYMPYFKIEIEEEHPLLWDYKYNLIESELSGIDELIPSIKNGLIAELANLYLDEIGGFIKFETNPISTPLKNSNGTRLFFTNQKLFNMAEPILLKYGVIINNIIIKSEVQKGWAYKPNAKVMLFRNPFVTSKKSTRGLSYIIADDFKIEMNSESITIDKK